LYEHLARTALGAAAARFAISARAARLHTLVTLFLLIPRISYLSGTLFAD
jgi:hypothetical protein